MTDIAQVLAGARHVPAAAEATRTAFIIGNTGKLGEELLNVLLERPEYAAVYVGVRKAMSSHVPRLHPLVVPGDLSTWNPCAGMRRGPEDAYLCIEPEAKSFWKIAKPFVAITSAQAVAIARRLRAAGASRIAVITPLEAILQMGMAPAIRDTDELAILGAGFARMLVLRPSQEGGRRAAPGFFARVGGVVTGTLGSYMTPKTLQPVRVRRAAQVAVDALATMDDGVQVMGAERLRELVGDPMVGKGG
ncbi:MAG: hypothetical protein ACT4P9_02335 [Betaproteobacteria bacterium]